MHYHKISHLSTANIGGFLFNIFAYTLINKTNRGRLSRTRYGEPSPEQDRQREGNKASAEKGSLASSAGIWRNVVVSIGEPAPCDTDCARFKFGAETLPRSIYGITSSAGQSAYADPQRCGTWVTVPRTSFAYGITVPGS